MNDPGSFDNRHLAAAQVEQVPPPKPGTGSGYMLAAIFGISALAGVATVAAILLAPVEAQLALISAITTFALTIITPLLAILQRQNQQQVRELHLAVNSRLTALLASTAAQSSAEGELVGRDYRQNKLQQQLDRLEDGDLDNQVPY